MAETQRDRALVYSLMVREMLPDERQRMFGEGSLNTSELLAIILNTGVSRGKACSPWRRACYTSRAACMVCTA